MSRFPTYSADSIYDSPSVQLTLPDTGKVTGTISIRYLGWCVRLETEGAHHNDNNPCVVYRGHEYLVTLDLAKGDDGILVEHVGVYKSPAKRRGSILHGEATPAVQKAIDAALTAFAREHYDAALDRVGILKEAQRTAELALSTSNRLLEERDKAIAAYDAALDDYCAAERRVQQLFKEAPNA